MPCGHGFCRGCLAGWWARAAAKTCPTCRKCVASSRSSTVSTVGVPPPPQPQAAVKSPKRRRAVPGGRERKAPTRWSDDPLSVVNLGGKREVFEAVSSGQVKTGEETVAKAAARPVSAAAGER